MSICLNRVAILWKYLFCIIFHMVAILSHFVLCSSTLQKLNHEIAVVENYIVGLLIDIIIAKQTPWVLVCTQTILTEQLLQLAK